MIRALLAKTGVKADAVSEVILGQVLTAGSGQNAARQSSLKTSSNKILQLGKRDGKWLILQERVGN